MFFDEEYIDSENDDMISEEDEEYEKEMRKMDRIKKMKKQKRSQEKGHRKSRGENNDWG